jgi:prepilin peptidase CpaA
MENLLFYPLFLMATVSLITDLRYQRIPNVVTLPTMLLALSYHTLTSGWTGLMISMTGLLLGMALLFIPYIMGGMGAGDVKMLGAMGALAGPHGVIAIVIYAAIAGGVYVLLLLLFNRQFRNKFLTRYWTMLKTYFFTRQIVIGELSIAHNGPKLCYGIAIATGAYVYMSDAIFALDLLSNNILA